MPLRFLVGGNVGQAVAQCLDDLGHDVIWVGTLDSRMSDRAMMSRALQERRIVVTMDNDSGELVYQAKMPHAGGLLLRMPGATGHEKTQIVVEIVTHFEDQLQAYFCVYH